jgi:hypothetical protein
MKKDEKQKNTNKNPHTLTPFRIDRKPNRAVVAVVGIPFSNELNDNKTKANEIEKQKKKKQTNKQTKNKTSSSTSPCRTNLFSSTNVSG